MLSILKKWILGESEERGKEVRTPEELAKFSIFQTWMLRISYFFLTLCYLTILIQLLHSFPNKICYSLSSSSCLLVVPNPSLTYIALILAPLAWLVRFIIWHKRRVYNFRLEDPSEVTAIIREAETAEKRLEDKPDDFGTKLQNVKDEAKRLEDLGNKNWTDYQILNLKVMLVDFLKPNDLKERARSSLEKLLDYPEITGDRFEADLAKNWSDNIKEACKKIDDIKIDDNTVDKGTFLRCRDDAAEPLRGKLRRLLRNVTDLDKNWAEGTAIIHSLMIFGVIVLPHILGIGLLPLFYKSLGGNLFIHNLAMLGICGSLTAVLMRLYQMYRSNVVEIGDTKGRNQLNLAILGTALGLVAGILFYAMVAGGLLDGDLFPNFPPKPENHFVDVTKAIFWGVASGFSFELIFNRMGSISSQEM